MAGLNELEVALKPGLFVTVTSEDASFYNGPGTVYGRTDSIAAGEVLEVIGQDESGDWLLVVTAAGEELWLDAASVGMEDVDLSGVTAVAAPATPTPALTTAAAPAPVSQPPHQPPLGHRFARRPFPLMLLPYAITRASSKTR